MNEMTALDDHPIQALDHKLTSVSCTPWRPQWLHCSSKTEWQSRARLGGPKAPNLWTNPECPHSWKSFWGPKKEKKRLKRLNLKRNLFKSNLPHAGIATAVVLCNDSRADDVKWCRDGVADGAGNSTTQKVAHIWVVLENLNMSAGAVQLIVGGKLSQSVEHAEKLSWNMTLPQAVQALIAEDREQSLNSSRVAGSGDSRNRLDLKLQSNFWAVKRLSQCTCHAATEGSSHRCLHVVEQSQLLFLSFHLVRSRSDFV